MKAQWLFPDLAYPQSHKDSHPCMHNTEDFVSKIFRNCQSFSELHRSKFSSKPPRNSQIVFFCFQLCSWRFLSFCGCYAEYAYFVNSNMKMVRFGRNEYLSEISGIFKCYFIYSILHPHFPFIAVCSLLMYFVYRKKYSVFLSFCLFYFLPKWIILCLAHDLLQILFLELDLVDFQNDRSTTPNELLYRGQGWTSSRRFKTHFSDSALFHPRSNAIQSFSHQNAHIASSCRLWIVYIRTMANILWQKPQ